MYQRNTINDVTYKSLWYYAIALTHLRNDMCRQTRSNPRLRGFGQSGQDPNQRKTRELHRLKTAVLFLIRGSSLFTLGKNLGRFLPPLDTSWLGFASLLRRPMWPMWIFELRGTEMGDLQTAPEVLLNWFHNFDSGWKPHRTFDVYTRLHIANAPDYREPRTRIRIDQNVVVLLQSHDDVNVILAIVLFLDILSYFQLYICRFTVCTWFREFQVISSQSFEGHLDLGTKLHPCLRLESPPLSQSLVCWTLKWISSTETLWRHKYDRDLVLC